MNRPDSTAAAAPSGRRFSLRQFAVAALFTFVGLYGAFALLTGKPAPQPKAPEAARLPIVEVLVAAPESLAMAVQTQGTVEPLTRIALVAQLTGIVESVSENFNEGGFFKAGETLLQIERDDYEFAVARARAAVAAAEQTLAEERGRARQAEREWRDLGAVSANDLFLRKPQIKAAEAALDAANADLAAAELALARTTVKAPFDGRVEAQMVNLGQYVAPGSQLADVYATDTMEVRLPLTDSQLALLDLPLLGSLDDNEPVAVINSRFGGRDWQWTGRIRRTEAEVDRSNRVVYAIAEVDTPFAQLAEGQPPLSPGMFVSAEIGGRAISDLTTLPATALRADNTVLVVREGGQLERRAVDVQLRRGDQAWVTGLAAGQRIVTEQSSSLVAGAFVDVVTDGVAGEL